MPACVRLMGQVERPGAPVWEGRCGGAKRSPRRAALHAWRLQRARARVPAAQPSCDRDSQALHGGQEAGGMHLPRSTAAGGGGWAPRCTCLCLPWFGGGCFAVWFLPSIFGGATVIRCQPQRPHAPCPHSALAGCVSGRTCTAYPACGPEVTAGGGNHRDVGVEEVVIDGNLVSPAAGSWPGCACSRAACPTSVKHDCALAAGASRLAQAELGQSCVLRRAHAHPLSCAAAWRLSLAHRALPQVTAAAWPAHPKWLAAFVDVLGECVVCVWCVCSPPAPSLLGFPLHALLQPLPPPPALPPLTQGTRWFTRRRGRGCLCRTTPEGTPRREPRIRAGQAASHEHRRCRRDPVSVFIALLCFC